MASPRLVRYTIRMATDREFSKLDIVANGIAHRAEDGRVVLVVPHANGSGVAEVEVDPALAARFSLATGDVVEGITEPIPGVEPRAQVYEEDDWDYDERDEPAALRGEKAPAWLLHRTTPERKLVEVRQVNSLSLDEATERPAARLKRNSFERVAPHQQATLATGPNDATGRLLDFAAPLGLGYAGIVHGPHGAGLTRTLQAVARGVAHHTPDCLLLILLIRARGEEVTDWRRRFPAAEVVVCPTARDGLAAEETLRLANLTLAAAQRQTELGRQVVLLVDSLTGLWGAMLEGEEADAQREADRAWSRQSIREWMQAAGSFAGEGLLGSGLGGSLTIVGSVWSQAVDEEAEEEGELHPHLRLLEHVLPETGWRVALSGALAADRLFPTVRIPRSLSRDEDRFVTAATMESIRAARAALAGLSDRACYDVVMNALVHPTDLPEAILASLEGS
jgi:hypothetical protein